MLRGFGIAGLALAASIIAAAGQEMKSPRISSTQVDWDAAVLELAPIDALRPADATAAMAELNRATGERFANIAASPVPVLLPFDTAAFLRHRSAAADAAGLATTSPDCARGLPLRLQRGPVLLSRPRRLRRRGHGARPGDARTGDRLPRADLHPYRRFGAGL